MESRGGQAAWQGGARLGLSGRVRGGVAGGRTGCGGPQGVLPPQMGQLGGMGGNCPSPLNNTRRTGRLSP